MESLRVTAAAGQGGGDGSLPVTGSDSAPAWLGALLLSRRGA